MRFRVLARERGNHGVQRNIWYIQITDTDWTLRSGHILVYNHVLEY